MLICAGWIDFSFSSCSVSVAEIMYSQYDASTLAAGEKKNNMVIIGTLMFSQLPQTQK